MEHILGDWRGFLSQIFASLSALPLSVDKYELDHICYRVDNNVLYEEKKKELSSVADMLHETLIGGRMIATYRLHHPLQYENRQIYLIELPSVKPASPYPTGLEHCEFVIDVSFDEFISSNSHISFDTSAANKHINPDISIALGKAGCVKFHHNNLADVIKMEKEMEAKEKGK